MSTYFNDITDGGLPRSISGLGQTSSGKVFDDGTGTVMTLSLGVRAPRQVTQMQKLLNTFGYKLAEDGIFGAGSAAAVKLLQKKLGMSQTGVYDKALDARVTGMNQSGIIEASAADVANIKRDAVAPEYVRPSSMDTTLVAAKDAAIQQQVAAAGGGSFMDKLKVKWTAFKADPNFKYYAAGGAVLVVAAVVLPSMLKPAAAPAVHGLRRSHRKY